ncbi:MAG: helix-turn-helix domain-containing protein [Clostridia bacterium]|nr:helix-turn-helix domain-containing protein [Clostridia bacterium]MBR3680829.1 helix-turn-helix domain-containing protein [Clostridia bacterium]
MSNRLFQTVIHQMKEVVGRTVGVIDENGIIVACSEVGKIGESKQRVREELAYSQSSLVLDGYTYRTLAAGSKNDCIVFVEGTDRDSDKTAQMLAVSLGSIKSLYDEKYDKGSFIKNIILDNILPNDIYIKSNELHFNNDDSRAVIVVKFQGATELPPYEIIQSIVTDKNRDYVINISEQDIVIVKEVAEGYTSEQLEKDAISILRTASTEYGAKLLIGISSVVEKLKDLARAYKEARIALEVGKVFDIERPVMSYENLGIGRLIYQLPTTLCEIFLQEVFKKGSLESLDRETLMTVQAFFENNLNVSETSRKLFVHRNTLVYRLEKIRKLTGLDLREFDHAVTFKVALMVKKYLVSKPTKF